MRGREGERERGREGGREGKRKEGGREEGGRETDIGTIKSAIVSAAHGVPPPSHGPHLKVHHSLAGQVSLVP